MKENKSKKIVIAVLVFALVAAALFGVYHFFGPKTAEGSKAVKIIVTDDQGESTEYDIKTDAEYLKQAMEEAEGLEFAGEESDYGLMVNTVNDVTADYNENGAYWAFYVNGEYCNYGIGEQVVNDGDEFTIAYTTE